MTQKIWTVSEAKSRLSEILRLAQKDPQRIGTQTRYVVLTEAEWLRLQKKPPHAGKFLIKALKGAGEIPVADRKAPDRPTPFTDLENE